MLLGGVDVILFVLYLGLQIKGDNVDILYNPPLLAAPSLSLSERERGLHPLSLRERGRFFCPIGLAPPVRGGLYRKKKTSLNKIERG
jgi:hypothetical protein